VRDLYRVLGVERSATQQDIQRAYRRKAKSSHPDGGGSVEAFGELATAYAVLSDADRRERYDRTGEVELPKPDNRDGNAVEIIAQKLGMMIHAEQDVTVLDLDALLEQTIRDDIDARKASNSSLKRAIQRVTRLRERVKRKTNGEANMLAKVLDWHELSARTQIAKNEDAIRSMERALEILEDYSFMEDLSSVAAERVSAALHDALEALDELAIVLNTGSANSKVPDAPYSSAFG
jgi:curved DNA-binding protein CbpA